ncbi:MAG TPA: polysaccharide deacetylase family protein [Ktedonobacteraceae bacterium]|nr:polysaccharide deacetylase family protein [Ktedonobacteraceae bacterium]
MITQPIGASPEAAIEQQLSPAVEPPIQPQDEQPTQPIDQQTQPQDEQPTQPIDQQTQPQDEQPTQALSIEEKRSEKPLSQPVTARLSKTTWRWLALTPLYILLIGGILVGRAEAVNWLATRSAAPHSMPVVIQVHHAAAHSSQLDTTIQSFMHTMMRKDWTTLWLMLSPDAQQLFQGEQDFEHFEQAKFGAITFVSFQESAPQMLQPWLDPDTTQVYPLAATLQVSLKASAPNGILSDPSRTALNNGLLHNTSLSLVPREGKWQVMLAGPLDLDAPVLVPFSPPPVRLLVPIFMYHHVSNLPQRDLLDYNLTVTTTDFNEQLNWLQAQGYHSINMTELFDSLYYGKVLPQHPMILTFDDGYEDMYTDAVPALLAHHYRGVFYIITGMIGGRYMTWNQVRMLADYGMQIASHTIHHVNIGQPPAYTTTQEELQISKATLQAQLGEPIQFFCYPSGEPFHHDSYYEQQLVLSDLFNDGYLGATLDPSSFDAAIQSAQMPYQLTRIRVSGGESLLAFTGTLNVILKYDAAILAYH